MKQNWKCYFSLLEYEQMKYISENREPKNSQPAEADTAEICTLAGAEEKELSPATLPGKEEEKESAGNELAHTEEEEQAGQTAADGEERLRQQEIRDQLRREAELRARLLQREEQRARLLQREEQRAAELAHGGHMPPELTVAVENAAEDAKQKKEEDGVANEEEVENGKFEWQDVQRVTYGMRLAGMYVVCFLSSGTKVDFFYFAKYEINTKL
jgi:hypothetical protein